MSSTPTMEPITVFDGRDARPSVLSIGCGCVVSFTTVCPGKRSANEDALAIVNGDDHRAVLAIADGFGGLPSGDQAARLAIESIVTAVMQCLQTGSELREGILNGFDEANSAVVRLGVGSATTLAVVEIDHGMMRPYHVGDSEILVVGQRGRLRLHTVSHSPVAYAVEAGLIDRDDALHHEERNVVSNMVGSRDCRIDVGPKIALRPRDTLLVGSDGVFDNLSIDEVCGFIRKGALATSCARLVEACMARMVTPERDAPSKPDDLTVVLFRCG